MQNLIFVGPVLTASGYGEHARQLLRALDRSGKFDIYVKAIKWGQTPILVGDESLDDIRALISKTDVAPDQQFDISVQVTIPNEFKRIAGVNIGVTAGIEVDRASPAWISKSNDEVDFVVVPSRHSAETFANVIYKSSKDGAELRLNKPTVICPEGVDTNVFNTTSFKNTLKLDLEPEFNFLSVGLGLERSFGEDRKNISTLIKWFLEEFSGNKNVGLVLKVGIVNSSHMDLETCKARIGSIRQLVGCGEYPKIKLVHGRLSKTDLASLYKNEKIKAYISLTHGEGYGLPIIEAAACGLPVLATNWSGHLDFLSTSMGKRFISIDYDLVEIPGSVVWDGVMERGTRWANPKESDAKVKMRKIVLSYGKPKEWATELAEFIKREFDEKVVGEKFVTLVTNMTMAPEEVLTGKKMSMANVAKKTLGLKQEDKTLLYTMPMSAGDVFISTAIIDSLKKKFPDHHVIFATDKKYVDILKDNPNIYKVIPYEQWMMDISKCEDVFDEVYTPNIAVQLMTSNWIHGGKGRLLGDEFAVQCDVPFGKYFIKTEATNIQIDGKYFVISTGSGKGQWEARNYRHWKKVVVNLKKALPDFKIVQVGGEDDMSITECDHDLRGKTSYNQLASVLDDAELFLGIDSLPMHIAAAFGTPVVALFGSSHGTSTGPKIDSFNSYIELIEVERKDPVCKKACYKYQCKVDREYPCINHISPKTVVAKCVSLAKRALGVEPKSFVWDDVRPKIAGYTHVINPETQGYPYLESIKSMLGFCDEVVVVDGGSTDGSLEKIKALGENVKVFDRTWDPEEPGMDGMQKAFGRAMVSVGQDDFIWQQDADEVVHDEDYQKIRDLVERFPTDVNLIHLPVIELWGKSGKVRTDRHSWKWRLSRNDFRITHGINKDARVFDEKTGRTYSKKGMSDGCEYVDIMTNEFIPHKGFYDKRLEQLRIRDPEAYGKEMNKIFGELPSVFHYSWYDLERKVKNFKSFWNKTWSKLYNDSVPEDRFPGVETEEQIRAKAVELEERGGEHGAAKTFKLERSQPEVMRK